MADFNELLEMLRNPGEDGVPDTIYDDLGGAYNSLNDSLGARDADLAAKDAIIQDRESEISRLKAMGFDQLMAEKQSTDPGPGEPDSEDEDPDDSDPDSLTVDDLFDDK